MGVGEWGTKGGQMRPGSNANKQEQAVRGEERSRIVAYLRTRAADLSPIVRIVIENLLEDVIDGEHWRKP